MRRMLVLSIVLLTIFMARGSITQRSNASKASISSDTCDALSADALSVDPLSAVGHGTMLNAEGEVINVTFDFILEAQRYYVRSLFHQADEKQRAEFREKQQDLLQGKECDLQDQVYANAALIDWLINEVEPENASRLASINTFLLAEFDPNIDGPALGQDEIRNQGGTLPLSATALSGTAYINECRAMGVPIPPDWDPQRTQEPRWQHKGDLSRNQLFLFRIPTAEVWTFESRSPRGICFALPRPIGNTIILLGIICQGSDTSKVCFWDNQVNDRTVPIPKNTPKPLAEFAGGAELYGGEGNVCTDCHAGENPFIIHPNTVLQTAGGDLLKPNNWYDPLVHALWPQNPGPTTSVGSCTICHNRPINPGAIVGAFPEVSRELSQYCSAVLRPAFEGTKPIPGTTPPVMGSPATMPPPPLTPGDPSFREHADALLAACEKSKGELASDNITICPDDPTRCILKGNSPAESFTPCFGEDGECPRKKTLTFTLPEAAEVFIRYDLGQSHGCCADHAVGALRILLNGTEVHRDRIPYVNYGVQPISAFLEDFDYFFSDNVVEGFVRPVSQVDPTRVGPRLENYKIVNRFSLGNLAAGSYTVELQVGDAGWNSTFKIFR